MRPLVVLLRNTVPQFQHLVGLFGRRSLQAGALLLVVLVVQFAPSAWAENDLSKELPRIAPTEPDAALKTFVVAQGFQLELVAHEPLVHDPVAMAFDEKGRMYVVEMRGYSEQRDDNRCVVRLLTDDDHDGRFDRATDFVDGLAWPTALACYDDGLFIGMAPDILYCKDLDGDGRADLQRTVFTGFLRHNVQGLLNSFQWGVDNRIHGSASTCGGTIRRVDAGEDHAITLRGRDFSFDPRRLDIRPESGGGQHGLSFDAWGHKFVCANSDHLQAVIIADRYFARNPYFAAVSARESIAADGPQAEVFRISPVEPWRVVRTRLRVAGEVPGPIEGGGRAAGYFTGASGATIYTGDAWPVEYQQQTWAFIGDVGSNIVHRKQVVPNGASFIGRRVDDQTEFIASRDIWFRPAQFCNGPDGCLYLLDVYREVIEHPESLPLQIKRHLDLTSGRDRGRIYRIVPDGKPLRRQVDLSESSTQELVATLTHPNAWHRLTAARLLCERQSVDAVELLEQLTTDDNHPLGQMHALYVLASLDRLRWEIVKPLLAAPHSAIREHALVLSEAILRSELIEEWIATVAPMTDDASPRVRMQLALALGAVADARSVPLLQRLLLEGAADSWLRTAVYCSSADVIEQLQSQFAQNGEKLPAAVAKQVQAELDAILAAKLADKGEALRAAGGVSQRRAWEAEVVVEPLRQPPLKESTISEYLVELSRSDPSASEPRARGAELYKKHCATCHDVGAGQGGIGPNLATMKARGAEAIVTNVLDPNREVNPQFLAYSAELHDGRIVTGVLAAETATSITLAKNREEKQTVLKISVDRLQSTGKSLMPDDFDKQLTPQAMVDLVRYLTEGE